jgi:anti-sigma-K factor RskA
MPPGRPGYLIVQGLQPAPAGKTYQAWYLSGKEARSAGLLKVGGDGMAILSGLDPQQPVDAMAVTLEQDGGVTRPTQAPLVYGKVSS